MKTISTKGTLMAVLPAVVTLGLFYSLAGHIYLVFGRWPSIGTAGFNEALLLHERVERWCVTGLVLGSLCLGPVAALGCAIIPKARGFLRYIFLFESAVIVCFGLGLLAPKGFLNWWLD